jgi:hypothetical protein
MEWVRIFEQYGLVGLVIGILFFMAWRRDIWIMAFVKEQRDQMAKERECWQEKYDKIDYSMKQHNEQAREFHQTVNNAHDYQRREHEKMIQNLEEQYKVLLRINGEKT